MAGKPAFDWPEPGQILELFERHRTYVGVAQQIRGPEGPVSAAGLRHHVRKIDLTDRVAALIRERLQVDGPVDDPARVKAIQAEAELKALRRENSEYAKALASQEQFFERIVEAARRDAPPQHPLRLSADGSPPSAGDDPERLRRAHCQRRLGWREPAVAVLDRRVTPPAAHPVRREEVGDHRGRQDLLHPGR